MNVSPVAGFLRERSATERGVNVPISSIRIDLPSSNAANKLEYTAATAAVASCRFMLVSRITSEIRFILMCCLAVIFRLPGVSC